MTTETVRGPAAYRLIEFCNDHRISPAKFYKLRAEGKAPKIMKVGRATLITREAAAEWRRWMEAEAGD